ncbi:insulinase family protein [Candidatus Sumerlaeota bacterium]|nr:insulinase family protein [Candidatus Sumerlaeota bacterium]
MSGPKIHTLSNGLRVVCEARPHTQSVSFGICLAQGSRHEEDLQNGMTHFAEHLLFKGTPTHHWKEIASQTNLLGGHFNASTGADCVKLYGSVISRDLPDAFALLAGMFVQSHFPAEEVERERSVIIEEIAQYDDVPEDLCYERFTQALLLPHPVGRPVIGTAELVGGYSRDGLLDYWQKVLVPSRVIISAVGAFDESALLRDVEKFFGELRNTGADQQGLSFVDGGHGAVALDRDIEQVNFAFGVTGPDRHNPQRYAWSLYDTILGGGMGSRLFDEIREKRGLAYSIGSSINALYRCGYLMVSGSTRPETAAEAIEIGMDELRKLAADGPTASELNIAKRQLERSILLSLESNGVRAGVNGDRELYNMPHQTPEEVIALLEAVTIGEVQDVAREVVNFGQPAACLVGPLEQSPGLQGVLGGLETA